MTQLYTKEEQFWNWFLTQSDLYYNFEANQNIFFKTLQERLNLVDPNLVFEFSPVLEDKTRELTISADGVKSVFPAVIKLIDCAPKIDRWKFIAFRQPHAEYSRIHYGNIVLSFEDVFFRYAKNNGKLDIELNIRGYRKSHEWGNVTFLILDAILGEYDTEMSLGYN